MLNNAQLVIVTSAITLALISSVHASRDIHFAGIDVGTTEHDIETFALNWGMTITDDINRLLPLKKYRIQSNLEASLFYWADDDSEIFGTSVQLIFDYEFRDKQVFGWQPYVDFGTGIALLSNTEIGPLDLSSAFQFKNHLSLGIRKDNMDLSIRLAHLSNAGIKEPNEGINILSFAARYRF